MSAIDLLVQTGDISTDSLAEARQRQQLLGGTLEGHLLRLRAVTEEKLCKALREHNGCDVLALSGLEIPDSLVEYIPHTVAEENSVLPVAYDPVVGCLTVACLDPGNHELTDSLKSITGINDIRLVAAIEPILRCRIVDFYRNASAASLTSAPAVADGPEPNGTIIFVGPVTRAAEALAQAMASESRRVVLVDAIDEAVTEFAAATPQAVIAHDICREDYNILRDRLRKLVPECPVRFVANIAELVTSSALTDDTVDLLTADMRLCISLFCTDEELASGEVARYSDVVEDLCRRLGLPPDERLPIINAAYLEDLARLYLGEGEIPDWVQADGEGEYASPWPPELAAILAHKDRNVDTTYPDRLPLAVLGGNILRIASVYAKAISVEGMISREIYEEIRKEIWAIRAKEYLPVVADAFLAMLSNRLEPDPAAGHSDTQVLILSEDREYTASLTAALEPHGFSATVASTAATLADLYSRLWPEFLIVESSNQAADIRRLIQELIRRGVALDTVPAVLIAHASTIRHLSDLLDGIIEEVLPIEAGPELVAAKLTRLRLRMESEYSHRLSVMQDMGTHGTLADMNLIDLLQALGHAQKTVRISITACGEHLTMFLEDGSLIWAECGDETGAEAVYCGLAWIQGIWSVDPIKNEELPVPNNQLSIDALLIEGCHRLDEDRRMPAENSREFPDNFGPLEPEHIIHDA